jgi:hypothetical protein
MMATAENADIAEHSTAAQRRSNLKTTASS